MTWGLPIAGTTESTTERTTLSTTPSFFDAVLLESGLRILEPWLLRWCVSGAGMEIQTGCPSSVWPSRFVSFASPAATVLLKHPAAGKQGHLLHPDLLGVVACQLPAPSATPGRSPILQRSGTGARVSQSPRLSLPSPPPSGPRFGVAPPPRRPDRDRVRADPKSRFQSLSSSTAHFPLLTQATLHGTRWLCR